jgi:uncharacterized membrane protein YtjA (UPF0391 family)
LPATLWQGAPRETTIAPGISRDSSAARVERPACAMQGELSEENPMLEWLVLLAIIAGIASVLGYTSIAVTVATLAKLSLIVTAVVAVGLLGALLVQAAKERKRRTASHV